MEESFFLLPWLDRAIAGTTDIALEPGQKTPTAPLGSRDEVDYILETIAPYLALRPHRQEVLSVWSGAFVALAKDPTKTNSSDVSRDHVIAKETPSDVIVVAGGKWTTYRLMAEETVDLVLKTMRENGRMLTRLQAAARATWALLERTDKDSLSASVAQSGGDGFGGSNPDPDVSRHLATSYGDRAMAVASLASFAGLEKRLHPSAGY